MTVRKLALASVLSIAALASIVLGGCSMQLSAPRYAFAYGVENYRKLVPLTWPIDDATSITAMLKKSGTANTVMRTDSAVTKAAIFKDIASLQNIESNATVVFYFSGHGSDDTTTGDVYIIPYDGVSASGSFDKANWIDPASLSAAFAKLPTRNIIVLLDTCFSGGFVTTGDSLDLAPQNYGLLDRYKSVKGNPYTAAISRFADLLSLNASASSEPSAIVISAAGSEELSWEADSYRHGIFTYFLLEAAANGDSDGNGFVTATEAYAYAAKGIESSWNAKYWDTPSDGYYMDYYPHISGGAWDLVLFVKN